MEDAFTLESRVKYNKASKLNVQKKREEDIIHLLQHQWWITVLESKYGIDPQLWLVNLL